MCCLLVCQFGPEGSTGLLEQIMDDQGQEHRDCNFRAVSIMTQRKVPGLSQDRDSLTIESMGWRAGLKNSDFRSSTAGVGERRSEDQIIAASAKSIHIWKALEEGSKVECLPMDFTKLGSIFICKFGRIYFMKSDSSVYCYFFNKIPTLPLCQ